MSHHITKINTSNVFSFVQKRNQLPLIFLHGFCEDSNIWDDFLADFSDYFIVCIDLPGFGKSDLQQNCSIADMAFIVNAVLEDLNIKSCVLIAHSMGGYVALEFAKLYPEKIIGLGLFHSHPFADSTVKIEDRKKGIEFIQKNGSIHFVKKLIPNLFASRFGSNSSLIITELIHKASQYPQAGLINALEAMIKRVDNQAILKEATFSVLFIVGAEDTTFPKENSFNQLTLPNISDIHILDGVGHMGMFEAKATCVSIIKNFVAFVSQ